MWEEACAMLEEAERLHRQFFRLVTSERARPAWEPPVDIFEDEREVVIIVALPGVAPDRVQIAREVDMLIVRAESEAGCGGTGCEIHRLEIPYGYFERRIRLPAGRYESGSHELVNGCLVLRLGKLS
jgi:HSP20 family molecular chaperone IbpA